MRSDSSNEIIPIGIGELYATGRADAILVAYGLGSCVGVVLHDPESQVGGMAHVMLPESAISSGEEELAKYADTGVEMLFRETVKFGAVPGHIKARIAGGARMFNVPLQAEGMDIGARNVQAVKDALKRLGVPIVAADVGGGNGRTVRYLVGPGKVYVRIPGVTGEREL